MLDFLMNMILFTWISSALAGAVIMRNRGASGISGFFAGAIFGVIGLLMTLSTRRGPMPDEARCPACAEIVRHEAVICPHCRSTFDEAVALRELHQPKGQKPKGWETEPKPHPLRW